MADSWIQCAISALRRAGMAQATVRLGCYSFQKRRRQPRLADPRLARQKHHLPFTGLCVRPAPEEQVKFFFTPNKLSHAARVQRFETAFDRSRSQCSPGAHRPGNAFKVLSPNVLKLKQIAEQLSRALGYDDSVRLGKRLQARCKIGCLAHDPTFLRLSRS